MNRHHRHSESGGGRPAARALAALAWLLATPIAFAADFNSLPAAQRTEIHRRTDQQFFARHPELQGRSLGRDADPALQREYMTLRGEVMTQLSSSSKAATSSPSMPGSVADPGNWYGDVPPHSAAGGGGAAGSLETRANSLTQEARRLADEFSTASPQRMEQIRGRLQQMYQEAIALQKDYLSLAPGGASGAGGLSGGNASQESPGGPGGAGSGPVGVSGQLTPASSLAVSPRDFFQQLASERAQKAAVRDRQAEIMDSGAVQQQGYLDEGRTAFNKAAARAGLDAFNGVSRTAMAATAPEPLYHSYEALNAGASLSKDTGFSLFDADFNLNNPFSIGPRTDSSITPSSVGNGIRVAKDANSIFRNSERVANSFPPIFVPDDEPNVFNNFGHAPELDPGPSRLSQNLRSIGQGVEVLDGAANSVRLGNNLANGQYFDATKNAVDLGGNVASVAGNQMGGRVASGAKGFLAVGEGLRNAGDALDEKSRFTQSTQATIDQLSNVAEQRRRQAARERELNQLFLQLSNPEPTVSPNAVPPSGGPNQDYFKAE